MKKKTNFQKATTLLLTLALLVVQMNCFAVPAKAEATGEFLVNSTMEVTVDNAFPSVISYRWLESGALLYGTETTPTNVMINGKDYQPTVKFNKKSDTLAEYILTFKDLGDVVITVQISIEDNVLKFNVTDIADEGEGKTFVETIEFVEQNMVSVKDTQPNAQLTMGNNGGDNFIQLSAAPSDNLYVEPIGVLNTAELAASLTNNTIQNMAYTVGRIETVNGVKVASLNSNMWRYRYIDKTYGTNLNRIVELPWTKVVITDDANNDNLVDWQDGAVAHREKIMNHIYQGDPSKGILPEKDVYASIVTDFASGAQFSFDKMLDITKKMNYLMDGFGQQIEIKGYQSEGHDSAHPDYGNNTNRGAGGIEDMNELLKQAKEYNTNFGIHINNTEIYPEAKYYSPDMLAKDSAGKTIEAWSWLDVSEIVDRFQDAASGNLESRLQEMGEAYPDLGFVYVDVYGGSEWEAYVLSKKIQSFGIPMWTEFLGPLDQYAQWTHQAWGTGRLERMIYNSEKDVYGNNNVLMGRGKTGTINPMGFSGNVDGITASVNYFYNVILPYKYMMNSPLMKWTNTEATFANGVVSKVEGDIVNLYKDGKLIAENINPAGKSDGGGAWTDTSNPNPKVKVFIPWDPVTEEKIYHWNPDGGITTWDLPNSWSSVATVKLYQNTDTGRVFVKEIPVVEGKVTLDVAKETGYSVYKGEITVPASKEPNWGSISPVRDNGFDSHSFDFWKKSSESGNTDQIVMGVTEKGNGELRMIGGGDVAVTQTIKDLKPNTNYFASVWVEITGNRTATLEVSGFGDTLSKSVDFTRTKNLDYIADKLGTNYQRLKIPFTTGANGSGVKLTLKAAAGDSLVRFDDVRVMSVAAHTDKGRHYFYEDFEHTDFGWGPFVYSINGGGMQTHLSETNLPYTTDTINGKFSLKTSYEPNGEVMRTEPVSLKFEPNTAYTLDFLFMADHPDQYSVEVKSPTGGAISTALSAALTETGEFAASFVTGPYEDYYVAIRKHNNHTESAGYLIDKNRLVIDDFAVDIGEFVPSGLVSIKADDAAKQIKSAGAWTPEASPNAYCGTNQYADAAGAYKEYTFTGTAINILGSKQQNGGMAEIFIDGNSVGTIDTFAGVTQNGAVLYSKSGLENKTHTIRIEVLGSKNEASLGNYIMIDAFEQIGYQMKNPNNGTIVVNNADDKITYSGTWANESDIYSYLGDVATTNEVGATASYSFRGTSVSLLGKLGPNMGKIDVTIDGGTPQTVDLYSADVKQNAKFFERKDLAIGDHTVLITFNGTKNESSSDTVVSLDTIEYTTGTVMIDNGDMASTGAWTLEGQATDKGGSHSYSMEAGATMSSEFEGCNVRLYACKQQNAGAAAIYVDDVFQRNIVLTPKSGEKTGTQLVYEKNDMPLGKHSIKVVVLGYGNPNSDAANYNYVVIDAFEYDTYPKPAVEYHPVESISVSAVGGVNEITQQFGTLQMNAEVLPANADDKSIKWSVKGEDGLITDVASISHTGKVTANKNGKVIVKASSMDGSAVFGEALITITGQNYIVTKVDDRDPQITYNIPGNWHPWGDAAAYNGTVTYCESGVTTVPNSFEFDVTGTGFSIIGTTTPNTGMIDVFVNGELVADDVITSNSVGEYQKILYLKEGMEKKTYHVKVVHLGRQFQLDAIGIYNPIEETTKYDVTIESTTNGIITSDATDGKVVAGGNVTFTFAPTAGYTVATATVNGESVLLTDNKYTVTNVQTNIIVGATFEAIPPTDPANKADLISLVDYAKAQKSAPEYIFVVPVVKSALDARILSAEAIIADVNATQAEVDSAYAKLLDVVHMLSYTGDSTTLKENYDTWVSFKQEDYTTITANALVKALDEAKLVLDNQNALQAEIDAANDILVAAINGLEKRADMSGLLAKIAQANVYNGKLDSYIDNDGRKEFVAALANANAVAANKDSTAAEIKEARNRLELSFYGLREIPNKDKLQELINQANALDVAGYTANSVKARAEAISYAQTVMADPTATQEDVNAAITGIKTTTANLVLVEDEKTDDKETTDKETTDKTEDTKVPTTSDTTPLAVAFAVAMAGCACIVARKKATK